MHRVVTMKARRLKIEFRAQLLQKLFAWLFPNSHSAIALHVAVAAHRTQPGPRLPNLSAQKHEVDDLLNVGDSVLMLGQAHRTAKDHALRFNEDASRIFDLAFRDARLFEDVAPVRLAECRREFIKAARIFLDELLIENRARTPIFDVENFFHDSFTQRHVATDPNLQEYNGELGLTVQPVPG